MSLARLSRSLRLGALAAVVAVGLAACAGGSDSSPGNGAAVITVGGQKGWHGTPLADGYPLLTQTFTDTAGRSVVPAEVTSKPVTLVFFGYTSCPDVCNIVLANIAAALRGAKPQVRDSVELMFVATDPARDTPKVVREYLDRFDPAYIGLTAPLPTIEEAAADLHISYEAPTSHDEPGGYVVDHGAYTTAFVGGRARLVWSSEAPVADVRDDLARLVRLASAAS